MRHSSRLLCRDPASENAARCSCTGPLGFKEEKATITADTMSSMHPNGEDDDDREVCIALHMASLRGAEPSMQTMVDVGDLHRWGTRWHKVSVRYEWYEYDKVLVRAAAKWGCLWASACLQRLAAAGVASLLSNELHMVQEEGTVLRCHDHPSEVCELRYRHGHHQTIREPNGHHLERVLVR